MASYEKLRFPSRDAELDSESVPELSPPVPKASYRWRYLPCVALSAVLFGIGISAAFLALSPRPGLKYPSYSGISAPTSTDSMPDDSFSDGNEELMLECGDTHADAVARGCILDIMANAWVPPACYDPVAAAQALGPYEFYLDSNYTIQLSTAELRELESLHAFTNKGYHVAHCLYEWQDGVRAVNRVLRGESPVYVRTSSLSQGHVGHCSEVIMKQIVKPDLKDEGAFGLAKCVRLDAGEGRKRISNILR